MNNFLFGVSLSFFLLMPAWALDVGDISSFMNSNTSTLSKEIRNMTDTGRLINIHIERITSPLDDGVMLRMENRDEVLLTPSRMALPAKSSEVVRFFYNGPADDKERYYRIFWSEHTLSDAPIDNTPRHAVVTTSARIGTILVVAPRKVDFRYQYLGGEIRNTGNATLRIIAFGPCLNPSDGNECKETFFLMPGKSRRSRYVNVEDRKGRIALWQAEQFIPVK